MLSISSVEAADRLPVQQAYPQQQQRLAWLDMTKVYGIFFVYYAHFSEKVAEAQGFIAGTVAYQQHKFIYAFHMPLFFILSGFVHRHKEQPLGAFIYQKLLTRALPALFFNLVAVSIYFIDHTFRANNGFDERYSLVSVLTDILSGYPFGNFPTWFLVCLFTLELINYLVYPFIQGSLWKRVSFSIVCLVIGYYLSLHQGINLSLPFQGLRTWSFNEALVAMSFYQLGIILKQLDIISWFKKSVYRYVGCAIALIITIATYDLNQGFMDPRGNVFMALADYGNLFWFVLTGLSGAFFVIFLGLGLPDIKGGRFLGRNTLILLGMNFFFIDFLGNPIISQFNVSLFNNWVVVTLLCTGLTLGSFLVVVPMITVLHRLLPQVIGKPKVQGPLLPALLQ